MEEERSLATIGSADDVNTKYSDFLLRSADTSIKVTVLAIDLCCVLLVCAL